MDNKKEEIDDHLLKLANTLDKNGKHKHSDHDDLDYFGLRELENLFGEINNDNSYKQVLVRSSFKNNYKQYESRGDKEQKKLSIKEYLYMIMPHLAGLINDTKNNRDESNEWKIQLNMGVNFISSNDTAEIRTFFVRSDNEEIRLSNGTSDNINGLSEPFLSNYQNEEKILRYGGSFVIESVDSLSYYIHKINLKRGKSYLKSPEWILNKRATINTKNKDKYFQYAITTALNHQTIENHPEKMSNINPFIDQYNRKSSDFSAGIKD